MKKKRFEAMDLRETIVGLKEKEKHYIQQGYGGDAVEAAKGQVGGVIVDVIDSTPYPRKSLTNSR